MLIILNLTAYLLAVRQDVEIFVAYLHPSYQVGAKKIAIILMVGFGYLTTLSLEFGCVYPSFN